MLQRSILNSTRCIGYKLCYNQGTFRAQLLDQTNNKLIYSCPLLNKKQINHDSFIYEFGLQSKAQVLGIPVGQHITIHANRSGQEIKRKFTPISEIKKQGSFDLLIKIYRRNIHPEFPEGGLLTQQLEHLKVGEQIDISGPIGKIQYLGDGVIDAVIPGGQNSHSFDSLVLCAAGTGITPMFQMIQYILKEEKNKNVKLYLIFANKSERDILLKDNIDQLQKEHPQSFQVKYVIDKAHTNNWEGSTGYLSLEIIKSVLPQQLNERRLLACTCGPTKFNQLSRQLLKEFGLPESEIIKI